MGTACLYVHQAFNQNKSFMLSNFLELAVVEEEAVLQTTAVLSARPRLFHTLCPHVMRPLLLL